MRYINISKLPQRVPHSRYGEGFNDCLDQVLDAVEEKDLVEVVRCIDCKHRYRGACYCPHLTLQSSIGDSVTNREKETKVNEKQIQYIIDNTSRFRGSITHSINYGMITDKLLGAGTEQKYLSEGK